MTDGAQILLGHATRSPRWDIPKGVMLPDEAPEQAAMRELKEETGLSVQPNELVALGIHGYLPRKDLALFLWRRVPLPDPRTLHCASVFVIDDGRTLPEFDRFGLFDWEAAVTRVGRNMARVLREVRGLRSGGLPAAP
ncbi:MAG: NUDIX hydrolase [Acetobacteraceae bacterium]